MKKIFHLIICPLTYPMHRFCYCLALTNVPAPEVPNCIRYACKPIPVVRGMLRSMVFAHTEIAIKYGRFEVQLAVNHRKLKRPSPAPLFNELPLSAKHKTLLSTYHCPDCPSPSTLCLSSVLTVHIYTYSSDIHSSTVYRKFAFTTEQIHYEINR
jgi:hypothetical protein